MVVYLPFLRSATIGCNEIAHAILKYLDVRTFEVIENLCVCYKLVAIVEI